MSSMLPPTPPAPAQPVTAPPVPAKPAVAPPVPARPAVHPHLQPDCVTHDAPGSLGVTTLEGKDPCHEEQLTHPRTRLAEPAAGHSGLALDWSGKAMVQAFVMQEVLTRPCDRRRR